MRLKFAIFGDAPAAILWGVIAAVLLALPVGAQEAGEDAAAEPEASTNTVQEAQEEGDAEASPESAAPAPAAESAAAGGASQDPDDAGETAGEAAEGTPGGPVVVDIEEGSVLDDQTFEGVDDDFIPSEEIPIDQPIPFPTDI